MMEAVAAGGGDGAAGWHRGGPRPCCLPQGRGAQKGEISASRKPANPVSAEARQGGSGQGAGLEEPRIAGASDPSSLTGGRAAQTPLAPRLPQLPPAGVMLNYRWLRRSLGILLNTRNSLCDLHNRHDGILHHVAELGECTGQCPG